MEPRAIQHQLCNSDAEVIVLPDLGDEDTKRLAKLAVERRKIVRQVLVELVRGA